MANRTANKKVFELDDPLFKTALLVQVGGSLNNAIRVYAERIGVEPWEIDSAPGREAHFTSHRPHKNGCLWLKSYDAGLLAHEAVHAAHYLLGEKTGLTLSDSSEEAYAYYVEWVVREVTSRCRR